MTKYPPMNDRLFEFEEGDEVQVIGIGERGYNLMEVSSGMAICECGWDLFEN